MDIKDLKKMEDEESAVMKTLKGATAGLVVGTIWGSIVASWRDVPRVERNVALPGLIRTLKMMGNHGATFAAISGVFIGIEQIMQHYRMKRDYVNGAVGGFISGATVLGYKGRSIPRALSAGAVFAVASTFMEVVEFKKHDEHKEYSVYTREKRPEPTAN